MPAGDPVGMGEGNAVDVGVGVGDGFGLGVGVGVGVGAGHPAITIIPANIIARIRIIVFLLTVSSFSFALFKFFSSQSAA